jgi:hypothetical protein
LVNTFDYFTLIRNTVRVTQKGLLPRSGLGGAGEVKHAELAVHLGRLQLGLEPVQQLHHLRVQLKVREVVVHPKQEDPCHLVMWRRASVKPCKIVCYASVDGACGSTLLAYAAHAVAKC